MFDIKQATQSDIPVIRELCHQVWPHTYSSILGSNQVAYMLDLFYAPEKLQSQMEEPGHKFIICITEDEPSAFASYSEIGENIFKLHKIYIIPGRQGRGLGKLIMSHITDDIKANGGKALRLNVNRYNYPALEFYNKVGFKLYAQEDIDIGGGYFMNDYVLNMDLD